MKETLAEVNALQAAGIIGSYAIGGAMGATFYLEPVATYDLDIFVVFEEAPLILTLTPIYEFLQGRGHTPSGDAIEIHGWPVQFLAAEAPLILEATQQAFQIDYEGELTWVMSAEHLMVIALQTGRAKDHARIAAFIEAGVADPAKLRDILERHQLQDAWRVIESKFTA